MCKTEFIQMPYVFVLIYVDYFFIVLLNMPFFS